jgi:hypothetical protein
MAGLGCRKVADRDCLKVAGQGCQEVAGLSCHADLYQGLPVLVSVSRCLPRLMSYHVVGTQRQRRT